MRCPDWRQPEAELEGSQSIAMADINHQRTFVVVALADQGQALCPVDWSLVGSGPGRKRELAVECRESVRGKMRTKGIFESIEVDGLWNGVNCDGDDGLVDDAGGAVDVDGDGDDDVRRVCCYCCC